MEIRKIAWQDTLDIRHKVLWPDKPKEFCMVDGDETANHYGILSENQIVGVASTYRNKDKVRLRKFAVDTKLQNTGYGSEMLRRIIELEKQNAGGIFWCDARETAIGFYKRFGLQVEGDAFIKSGKRYFKMSISL